MDKLDTELNEYNLPKEFDSRYFTKAFFEQVDYIGVNKKRPRRCMFPGCTGKSIAASHSIQKEGPLREISRKGEVIHPQHSHSQELIDFARIGLSKASVFPGFCMTHEQRFAPLENGHPEPEVLSVLQNFRALCRETVLREIQNKAFSLQKEKYVQDQLAVHDRMTHKPFHSKTMRLIGYRDYITDRFDRMLEENENMSSILSEFYEEYRKYFSRTDCDLSSVHIDTDMRIPVSLSGFSTIELEISDRQVKFIALGSVIPKGTGTEIAMTTLSKWRPLLNYYLKNRIWHNLAILSLVESWMMYGTDNWYMDPEVYAQLPNSIQTRMKSDFTDLEKSASSDLPYSIFRELRQSMILGTENLIATSPDLEDVEEYRNLLEIEKSKMLFL